MADEAELQINIIPDEDGNLADAVKPEAKTEVKDAAVQDLAAQFKDLESRASKLEQEKREEQTRRHAAEQEAAHSRNEAENARKAQTNSQFDTITTAISASEQDVEGAKQAIRTAKATGDIDAETEALDRLAKARATLLRLDEAKQDIEARQKLPPKRQAPTDPVEAFCAGRTNETASWIRAHPEYVKSPKGLRKLTAADAVAQAEDLIPDTPEYFARVEDYLGLNKAEEVTAAPTEASQVKPVAKPKAAPPVAPGGSVAATGNGSGPIVTLTRREAAAAEDGTHTWTYDDPKGKFKKGEPIGTREFARRKLAMMKDGRYDRWSAEN